MCRPSPDHRKFYRCERSKQFSQLSANYVLCLQSPRVLTLWRSSHHDNRGWGHIWTKTIQDLAAELGLPTTQMLEDPSEYQKALLALAFPKNHAAYKIRRLLSV